MQTEHTCSHEEVTILSHESLQQKGVWEVVRTQAEREGVAVSADNTHETLPPVEVCRTDGSRPLQLSKAKRKKRYRGCRDVCSFPARRDALVHKEFCRMTGLRSARCSASVLNCWQFVIVSKTNIFL